METNEQIKDFLNNRPKEHRVFEADLHYKIYTQQNITPKEPLFFDIKEIVVVGEQDLDAERRKLARRALSFAFFDQYEWEKFLQDYIAFSARSANLNSAKIVFDSTMNGYGASNEASKTIFLSPSLLIPPRIQEDFVKYLHIIDHEMTHIADFVHKPVTYKKFDNENGQKLRYYSREDYNKLLQLLEMQEIRPFATAKYLYSEWEVHARENSYAQAERFFDEAFNQALMIEGRQREEFIKKQIHHLDPVSVAEGLQVCNLCVKHDEAEARVRYAKENANWQKIKPAFNRLIDDYCSGAEMNSGTIFEIGAKFVDKRELMTESLINIINLNDEPELYEQENFDKIYDYLIKNYTADINAIYNLIVASRNTKSKQMIDGFFANYAKISKSTLGNFHSGLELTNERLWQMGLPEPISSSYFEQAYNKQASLIEKRLIPRFNEESQTSFYL